MLKLSELQVNDSKNFNFFTQFQKIVFYQRMSQNLEKDTFREKFILNQEKTTIG